MPDLRDIALAEIDEPEIAGRIAMDEEKLAELASDIARNGQLQPIGLKIRGERYEIEFGHRRFLAVRSLNRPTISALVYQPGELREGAALLSENYCREDVTAAEEALFIAQMQEKHGYDEAALCQTFGHSADWIGDRLRLLAGDKQVFDALAERKISFSVARELNKCPNEDMRRYYLTEAKRCGAKSRVVRQWVENYRATLAPQTEPERPAVTSPTDAPPPVVPFRLKCDLCGGDRDPYNLVTINLHRWEWEEIQKVMQQQAEV